MLPDLGAFIRTYPFRSSWKGSHCRSSHASLTVVVVFALSPRQALCIGSLQSNCAEVVSHDEEEWSCGDDREIVAYNRTRAWRMDDGAGSK